MPRLQALREQEINIREFKGVVGSWVGGKIW